MTEREADRINIGELVAYEGTMRRVESIKVGLIHGPHFRLEGVEGLTSYRLISLSLGGGRLP